MQMNQTKTKRTLGLLGLLCIYPHSLRLRSADRGRTGGEMSWIWCSCYSHREDACTENNRRTGLTRSIVVEVPGGHTTILCRC